MARHLPEYRRTHNDSSPTALIKMVNVRPDAVSDSELGAGPPFPLIILMLVAPSFRLLLAEDGEFSNGVYATEGRSPFFRVARR